MSDLPLVGAHREPAKRPGRLGRHGRADADQRLASHRPGGRHERGPPGGGRTCRSAEPASPASATAPALVANTSDANRGLNVNGRFKGERTLTVPRGTHIQVLFCNAGQISHSLDVVAGSQVPEMITPDAVVFIGGSSEVARVGDPVQKVRFLANKPGDDLLACGVGKHAMNGPFLKMVVSANATEPSFQGLT